MNEQERLKQEIRHMIKSVGHAELEDMFGDVLAANYTTDEVANTVKRASGRGFWRSRIQGHGEITVIVVSALAAVAFFITIVVIAAVTTS